MTPSSSAEGGHCPLPHAANRPHQATRRTTPLSHRCPGRTLIRAGTGLLDTMMTTIHRTPQVREARWQQYCPTTTHPFHHHSHQATSSFSLLIVVATANPSGLPPTPTTRAQSKRKCRRHTRTPPETNAQSARVNRLRELTRRHTTVSVDTAVGWIQRQTTTSTLSFNRPVCSFTIRKKIFQKMLCIETTTTVTTTSTPHDLTAHSQRPPPQIKQEIFPAVPQPTPHQRCCASYHQNK